MLKKILLIATIVVSLAIIILGYTAYNYIYKPNFSVPEGKKFFYVHTNATFDDVVDTLSQYMNNKQSFVFVSKIKKYKKIKPGRYTIKNGMSNNEIVNILRAGLQTPVQVTVPSSRTVDKLAEYVEKFFEFDKQSLLQEIYNPETLQKYNLNKHTVGTLFIPNTYEMYWTTPPHKFLERMKKEYDQFWNEKRLSQAQKIGLSPTQVSILASIVQAEQMEHPQERPIIAGLYINRLRRGIALQSDPTLIFASGNFNIKRVYNYLKDIDSPYNTYKYKGLPPGPILIPEISSLDAVLYHDTNNYLFMCAKEDLSGFHYFTDNLAQHNYYAKLYQQKLNQLGIR